MSFHPQATPQSSHLPSMGADRRIPSMTMPPGGPYPHTSADYRAHPPPFNLPPISQLNQLPANYHPTYLSHRYLPASHTRSNAQAYPQDAASFRGAGSTSYASSSLSAPAITFGSYSHHNNVFMYGGDRKMGTVGFDQSWVDKHLNDMEVISRKYSGEEKGKVYLGLWLAIRELGLRGRQNERLYIAKILMPYAWFKGDETVSEVFCALHTLDFINLGLLAKKYLEDSNLIWNMVIAGRTVQEFWIEEGRKHEQMHAHAQAQARAQAQAQAQC